MHKSVVLDDLLKMGEDELQSYLAKKMVLDGRNVAVDTGFVYSVGKIPILLVAHMDTVHRSTPTVCKSEDGEIYMAPEGIGGDDRAGIYAIMKIIEKYDCHVLFTQGEEIGGTGARAFVQSGIKPVVNFIIEPDRKGNNDAVFYDCGNDEFIDFVEKTTGYKEQYGTFSDISIIAPSLDRAAVNLSIGYYNQHTSYEHIRMSDVEKTIVVMGKLIDSKDASKVYEFKKVKYVSTGSSLYDWGSGYYSKKDYGYSNGVWAPVKKDTFTATTKSVSKSHSASKVAGKSKYSVAYKNRKNDLSDKQVYTGYLKYDEDDKEEDMYEDFCYDDDYLESWVKDETRTFLENMLEGEVPDAMAEDIGDYVYIAMLDYKIV